MGLAVSVKVNGLIIILLFPFLILYEHRNNFTKKIFLLKDIFTKMIIFIIAIISIISIIFYIHFSIGKTISNHSTYKASSAYKQIIAKGQTANIMNFPLMLRDNLIYMIGYSKGVPKYNACKPGENGSMAATWPFGNKSINYRWEKQDGKVSYLYLQGNPVLWFSGLVGIILAFSLIIAYFIFRLPLSSKRLFFIITLFSTLYFSYMLVMFNIERVMYLYHYLVPLIFSFIIFFSIINYIFEKIFYLEINYFIFQLFYS